MHFLLQGVRLLHLLHLSDPQAFAPDKLQNYQTVKSEQMLSDPTDDGDDRMDLDASLPIGAI